MSLLMDALKKAEEEKKQAAKRLQEVEMDARETSGENDVVDDEKVNEKEDAVPELYKDTSQFSLEPLSPSKENIEPEKDTGNDSDTSQLEVPTVDAVDAFSEGLTLENTVAEEVNSQSAFEETQKEIDLNDTTIIEGLSTEHASAPFDDTFHGVVFEEDDEETEVYEETLPGIPADQLAKDLGGGQYQPTPVAAKTVFSAGKPNKNQSSFKWWGIFVVLVLLAVGSFSIFYYFTVTPVSRELPSPLIARGIESSGVEKAITLPPVIEQAPETELITETISGSIEEKITVTSEVTAENQIMENEVLEQQDTVSEDKQLANEAAPVISENDTAKEMESSPVEKVETDENISEEISNNEMKVEYSTEILPDTENIHMDASLLNISKTKKVKQENVMISQAFKAYNDGHYDAAKSIYEDVLRGDPDNRDAHLGLAAIAIVNKDRKNAYSHYVHLLDLDPLDTLAMSSLIGLSNSADLVKDESAIKVLIQREGDVPYLYFLLGNLYAKQQRWANAQQAFFDAYRLDTTNPDYVLNLAVSLDRMGQYDAALDYYKTAIELSRNSSSSFDLIPVNQRILVLSKLSEAK